MTINKFQGKTKEEAIEKAKAEFGEDAVVMNVREIKPKGLWGIFKSSTFEVTVAMQERNIFSNSNRGVKTEMTMPDKINYTADENIKLPSYSAEKKEEKVEEKLKESIPKELEHVEAARAMGASDFRILFRYIFPLCISQLIIRLTLTMGLTILNEASLTFLGIGLDSTTPSWGIILSEARQFITTSPYLVYLPGIAIVWAVLAMNMLGDGLRDVLDPKLNS